MFDAVFHPATFQKGQEVSLTVNLCVLIYFSLLPLPLPPLSLLSPSSLPLHLPPLFLSLSLPSPSPSPLPLLSLSPSLPQNPRFKQLLVDTALDGIERELHIKLDRSNVKHLRMPYKGMSVPTVIRKKMKEEVREH